MDGDGIILFEYGTEGGGSKVYRLPDNSIIEKGSSGGILDEQDDPIKNWERKYSGFAEWWQNFTDKYTEEWILFSPLFIHDDIKSLIASAIKKFAYEQDGIAFHKQNWEMHL